MKTNTQIKKEFIDYLYSHAEWEHISVDSKEKYGTDILENVSLFDLQKLAEQYDYYKN